MPYTDIPRRSQADRPSATSDTSGSRGRSSRVRFSLDADDGSSSTSHFSKSSGSSRTLFERPRFEYDDDQYSLSSYRHPHDIAPPPSAHVDQDVASPSVASPALKASSATKVDLEMGCVQESNHPSEPIEDGGFLSSLIDNDGDHDWANLDEQQPSDDEEDGSDPPDNFYEQVIDEDDPRLTGERKQHQEDYEDLNDMMHKQMNYKERRKAARAVRIQYNVSSIVNREKFLIKLGRALMTFGAPSHRIEAQLLSAARILEMKAEFIHVPGLIMCSFINEEEKTSETHFIRCKGRMALGRLHEIHSIYRGVVHDELSAKKAGQQLDAILKAPPIYGSLLQCTLSFWIATLICPLAFGGSLVDMWLAGTFAVFLSIMRNGVIAKAKAWYAHVFEVCVVMIISFAARALSSIPGNIFCYNAIASASIVSILPGFLILSGSLELASKNIACGSIKMMYALIYTFFLGFGLQIGNDVYLVVDQRARRNLDQLAARVYTELSVVGGFVPDNGTFSFINGGKSLNGTFTFSDLVDPLQREHIVVGCFRQPDQPWYLQPFPWWTQFIIVPIFSLFSSLMNLQPIWTWDMLVMILISCVSYTTNKVANHFIPNRSDFVSFIGAFSVGILGNIYSRRMNGTAFTVMVTGVLFLVPSGLSAVGGITAQGNGIDIGGAMIAVVIGITCGLFVSQAIVYAFGTRKNAAVFSF